VGKKVAVDILVIFVKHSREKGGPWAEVAWDIPGKLVDAEN